jgi:hypothetical protein
LGLPVCRFISAELQLRFASLKSLKRWNLAHCWQNLQQQQEQQDSSGSTAGSGTSSLKSLARWNLAHCCQKLHMRVSRAAAFTRQRNCIALKCGAQMPSSSTTRLLFVNKTHHLGCRAHLLFPATHTN